MIVFSAALMVGCSSLLGDDPREEANQAITDANDAIARHNELFEQARGSYAEVREEIESGGETTELGGRISGIQETMSEARGELQNARQNLQSVREMDVDPAIEEYASLLSRAVETQLAAEAKEIEFYELLEEDPTLEENRDRAQELLDSAGEGYREAEDLYAQAREFAESNPEVLRTDSPTTPESTGGP